CGDETVAEQVTGMPETFEAGSIWPVPADERPGVEKNGPGTLAPDPRGGPVRPQGTSCRAGQGRTRPCARACRQNLKCTPSEKRRPVVYLFSGNSWPPAPYLYW